MFREMRNMLKGKQRNFWTMEGLPYEAYLFFAVPKSGKLAFPIYLKFILERNRGWRNEL